MLLAWMPKASTKPPIWLTTLARAHDIPGGISMTDPRTDQIEGALDVLIFYPADLIELVAFVEDVMDAERATEPCDRSPLFQEEN